MLLKHALNVVISYLVNRGPEFKKIPGRNTLFCRLFIWAFILTVLIAAQLDPEKSKELTWLPTAGWVVGTVFFLDLVQMAWAYWRHFPRAGKSPILPLTSPLLEDPPPSPPPDPKPLPVPTPLPSSAFIAGPPITDPRQFFGRQIELSRLFNLLKTHPLQNAAIIGAKRSGKTSLLHYLQNITTADPNQLRPQQRTDWLPKPEHYRWIFVDFQDVQMQTRASLLRYLLESMRLPIPTSCTLENFMDQVGGNITQPTVILMDEIGVALQRCPEFDDTFWESLRSLASNQTDGYLAFILSSPENPFNLAKQTGHTSPFFNIFAYSTTLGPLTDSEARQLVANSPTPFDQADIDWIITQSGRYPLLLQILCRERLAALNEKDPSNAWQAEWLRQMEPFSYLLNQP